MQHSAVVECPKSMVGRVIGKGGETIKALQQYTGATIQVDQSREPTRVTISGSTRALSLASSMVQDIVAGQFKGFAMLRSVARTSSQPKVEPATLVSHTSPVYVEGYGFVPPSQDTALLGGTTADSNLLQPRGLLAPPPVFGSSALSHFARLRLGSSEPAAHHQLQKQLFAGLDQSPTVPGYQHGAGLQSQQLLQQLSILLQQQQQQQVQQQQAQQSASMGGMGSTNDLHLAAHLLNFESYSSKPLSSIDSAQIQSQGHLKSSPLPFESSFLPSGIDHQAVDSRSDSVESSYSAFGLPSHAYGQASLGGLATASLPTGRWI